MSAIYRVIFTAVVIIASYLSGLMPLCAQQADETAESPLVEPKKTYILFSVDYSKKIRTFGQDSIVLPAPQGGDEQAWELFKDMGYGLAEIRINLSSIVVSGNSDPDLPESYDFKALDSQVNRAIEQNSALMLIVEEPSMPGDLGRFSAILEHVIKHITMGWAQGFRLTERELRYVILDASPDRQDSFFIGRDEECQRLYAYFAKTVKKLNGKIAVGGPGFSRLFKDENDFLFKDLSPQVTAWMEGAAQGKVPVDVFYMRCRSMLPYYFFLETGTGDQKILAPYTKLSALYGRPKLAVLCDALPSGSSDSLHATALMNAIFCTIKGGADFIILPRPVKEKGPLYEALKGLNIFKDYPVQLETAGLDRFCMVLMAAKSSDGKKAVFVVSGNSPVSYLLSKGDDFQKKEIERELRALVAQLTDKEYPPLYERYHLSIINLPWDKDTITFRKYTVDGKHHFDSMGDREFRNVKELYFNERISLPGMDFIFFDVKAPSGEEKK